MKILENLIPDIQDNEIEASKLMWFSGSLGDLYEFNFELKSINAHKINIPDWTINYGICECLLPNGKIFCCGMTNWKQYGYIFFIIDENYNAKIISSEIQYIECSATYYNNYIYFCGGGLVNRFNIANWKREKLIKFQKSSYSCTCISFNGMILISGHHDSNIFVLDLLTLSLSSCQLGFEAKRTKTLYKWRNSAYLIDFSGKLMKSDAGNPFNWNAIGNISPWNHIVHGYKALYKDSLYFYIGSFIIKLDLKEKKFEEISIYEI